MFDSTKAKSFAAVVLASKSLAYSSSVSETLFNSRCIEFWLAVKVLRSIKEPISKLAAPNTSAMLAFTLSSSALSCAAVLPLRLLAFSNSRTASDAVVKASSAASRRSNIAFPVSVTLFTASSNIPKISCVLSLTLFNRDTNSSLSVLIESTRSCLAELNTSVICCRVLS